MSYCGALPTGESESHLLIDACLRGVREEARLDDDPVLPPVSSIRRRETIQIVEPPTASDVTDASGSMARSVWRRSEVSLPDVTAMTPIPRAHEDTVRRPQTLGQRMRWPVFLCGFIAGIFGGVAVMKSPVGRKPAVQRTVKATQRQATAVYAVVAVKAGLARP